MSDTTTQHTPADARGRIIRASILPIEDEETMIAGLRAGAEAVERGELDAEDFAGIWSQYLRELFRRASSVPTPANVRERVKEPTQALSNGDDPAALLRPPRGEGETWRAFLDALDEYEAAANLWADPEGPTAADMERLRQSRQRVIECARVLAALRSEARGEEDAVRRTWEQAVQRVHGCLDYCGGYRGAELTAFHSGIKTVIRALEAGLDAVDTQTAALDRIGAALRGEGGGE